ncbi:hemerythrin domain-containing protein [Polyangium mundeleinium]|uniref:Hemerythrin domain-containing protein n=1 Tax=Polyangium mundeleinium TaxID=2995306 RepID=A0ABT5EV05_9BACT|nr:hemerythrin domain-containing protein [Polyangium mundeleinium]MDC0744732.1 hemerythrin domain-containing protein [Polyangium mundeleinium]
MERGNRLRRTFLRSAGAAGAGLLVGGCAGTSASIASPRAQGRKEAQEEPDVSPAEDLMREHGVLNRVLLVYDESARRLASKEEMPMDVLASATGLLRRFIEEYHEKLEEEHLFPRFVQAGKLVDLVSVLRSQHEAGRRLTDEVRRLAASKEANRGRLVTVLRQFVRMYRPHEAREDTVLFPAFRSIVSKDAYEALGEAFEDREHELFGEHGFEDAVADVARMEQALGIDDLAIFTPR